MKEVLEDNTKNIHQYRSRLAFEGLLISSSCILHLLNDSYYINLQLSKMRKKVQAVNSMQYLSTLTLAEFILFPFSCFTLGKF